MTVSYRIMGMPEALASALEYDIRIESSPTADSSNR